MSMFEKNGGFTLVELIVVIAILAILAAVAVPAYTGYIAKAEEASKLQTLSAVNTAAQGLAAGEGKTVERITVVGDVVTVHVAEEVFDADADAGEVEVGTTITDAEVKDLTDDIDLGDFHGAYMVGNTWKLVKDACDTNADADTDGYCDNCGLLAH